MSNKAEDYIGKKVKLIIDRPIGSKHPGYDYLYEVNYGYVPNTKAPDGKELDAFYIGENKPLETAKGKCVAIIKRRDDNEDKLVVVSADQEGISHQEIMDKVNFQEKWFDSYIFRNKENE